MLKTMIIQDSNGLFLRQWLAASERAEKLWQDVEKNDREKTAALTLGIVPRLDLAGNNLISRLVGAAGETMPLVLRSPFEDGVINDDITEDEFNLLAAVGLLQTDSAGRYFLAIPEFNDADFKAAVEREGRRRSAEYDHINEEEDEP